MKIEGIVVSCYAIDVQLTRICVASIRNWYPQIGIWLLKDRHYGDFKTDEIEKYWNVRVYPGRQETLGWGFGKLEVLTELPARRLLLLDSDIVLTGRTIDRLEGFDEDMIVDKEDFDTTKIQQQFFPLDRLRQFDPEFTFPGYTFNTGQIVSTTGRITKQELAGLVNWETRTVINPEIFKNGEQGLLNYIVLRKMLQGDLTVRREPFMVWPGKSSCAEHIQVKDFTPEGRCQQLIHWAGLGWGKTIEEMPRPEILMHFQGIYYRAVPFGAWLRRWRRLRLTIQRACIAPLKLLAKKILSSLR